MRKRFLLRIEGRGWVRRFQVIEHEKEAHWLVVGNGERDFINKRETSNRSL